MKPLIPCLVKMYQPGRIKHQYIGLFNSTSDAAKDAMTRFGNGVVFATAITQTREVQA